MSPANRAWIRGRMATIKKSSGIAFSEEIFLSMLICLITKNKHLVLHTAPEAIPELKVVIDQHSTVVFGLTTATIVCHPQQTRADIIGAITGRHTDIANQVNSSTQSSQYQFPAGSYNGGHHLHHYSHHSHQQTPSGQYYQYSNPADEYTQRNAKIRIEKSRRSIATNHSEASEYSYKNNHAPSISSFKTTSERDQDGGSVRRGYPQQDFNSGADDSSLSIRYPESRPKSINDAMAEHIITGRTRKGTNVSTFGQPVLDQIILDGGSSRKVQTHLSQQPSNMGGNSSIASVQIPVTPVDFTFPRRRHESVSNPAGYNGVGETTGITYSGRRIAQAIILDDLENASPEVFAILMEMIVTKEINDRNRYVLPDLIIIAVFNSPTIPDKIPRQLLDYFAINGTYQYSIPQQPQPRILPVPPKKHALFRRTEWDELSKRVKVVTVSSDMMRYIRDVIVAVRTHEAVHGGLTARAALDLEAIMKTLAAIFQTTFVTPDLLLIAAEKVFSHRIELKSTRRKKMLAASSIASSSASSSSASLPSQSEPLQIQKNPRKGDAKGYQKLRQSQQQQLSISQGKGRRDSSSSDQSSFGGGSIVEHSSDSDEESSNGSFIVHDDTARERRLGKRIQIQSQGYLDQLEESEDEKTTADVVRDVLRVVYPPI
ncbi:hypothetical protein BGZ76_008631 [Entomortierella beljakovae]|nr:hypothetical protein BGZ76_008631 [Entomortierella beljakovae]